MGNKNLAMKALNEEFTGKIELDIEPEEIIVETEDDASTALRLVALRDKEIERIESLRAHEKAKVDAWADGQVFKLEKAKSYFLQPLEVFVRAALPEGKKERSVKFPNGIVGLRKSTKVIIPDDFQPDQYAGDPFIKETIVTKYSVDKAAIKKAAKETGEIPAYATVETSENFYYDTGKAKAENGND